MRWMAGLRAGYLVMGLLAAGGAGAEVVAAGATFPSKVYQKWAQAYAQVQGVVVRYQPTGSGDGIKKASERAVAFGGTDSPLSQDELKKRDLVQIPTLVGGIVPVVNLPGIGDRRLRLTGELLAAMMAGDVARWNDPRVAALNPGIELPPLPLRRVVRQDKSGTTEGFTSYLSEVAPAFAKRIGSGQLPNWPGEVLRGDGNDGVVAAVSRTPGALGYVSFDRVGRDGLAGVQLRNADGQWVSASESGFRSAIRQSDLHARGDDRATLMNRRGTDTWPITLTSFVLLDAQPQRATAAEPALRFLYWCFMHGDELTQGTGFAPLPVAVQARLAARFAAVRARDGAPIAYQTF